MSLTKLSAVDYVGNVVSSVEPIGGVTNSSIGEKPKNTTGKLTFYFSFSLLLCLVTLISKCFNHLPEYFYFFFYMKYIKEKNIWVILST